MTKRHARHLTCAGRRVATLDGRTLGWRILEALLAGPVVRDVLYTTAWSLPYRPPSSDNALYVAIHRLRKQLAGAGVTVEADGAGAYHLITPGPLAIEGDAPRPAPAPAPLFGRKRALEALQHGLASSRLVTLTGPGGVGKTRLAEAVLASAAQTTGLPPAVWVELGELRGPRELSAAVAVALGVPPGRTGESDEAVLLRHLSRRPPVLLVLDNAEHLLAAVRGAVAA